MRVEASNAELAGELSAVLAVFRRQIRRTAGGPFPAGSLSGAQIDLVRLVRQQPGVSVAEAAGELNLAPNTVSTLVRQLCEADVLVRTADSADRRVARLDLTSDARKRLKRWRDEKSEMLADAISTLDMTEKNDLINAIMLLNKLADQFGSTNEESA